MWIIIVLKILDIRVLLISIEAGGLSLHLSEANIMFIMVLITTLPLTSPFFL